MKQLLALMKLRQGETAEQFAKRVWQNLRDKNLVDSQNKLVLPSDKQEQNEKFDSVVREIKGQFKLDIHSVHGINHWQRVNHVGLYLASRTGADISVINLFAALHDSKRENEDYDPEHGSRAAEYALTLYGKGLLPINAKQLGQLIYACRHHSERNAQSDDITIQACWDADRLDLYRIGEIPNPKFLYTDIAKERETTDFVLRLLKR